MSDQPTRPRLFRPSWTDLAPLVLERDGVSLDRDTARLWSLVLTARHIPNRTRQSRDPAGGHAVLVQPWFADRAVEEIRLYRAENAPGSLPVRLADLRPVSGLEPTIAAMGMLILFHLLTRRVYPGMGWFPQRWVDQGSANAARILDGEWWRAVTALTLHGDGAHVLGNAVIGGVFVWLVSRRMGAGLAWLLTMLAGVLGNLINSVVLGPPHDAIGFSTGSFGAAGILAGMAPFAIAGGLHGVGSGSLPRRIYGLVRSALIPVGAGLGLLAMLGSGQDTDLGAHLFGFVVGVVLGLGAGGVVSRLGLPGKRVDAALYGVALALPVAAWLVAW